MDLNRYLKISCIATLTNLNGQKLTLLMRCLRPELVTQIREQIQELLEKAKNLDAEDLKLTALRKIIQDRQRLPE